jgi:pyrroline-5-carboxylate reductase
MKYRAGFIGCGNMGGTLARAAASRLGGSAVAVCDADEAKARAVQSEFGTDVLGIREIAVSCDYLFLGVKPQVMESVTGSIRDLLEGRTDFTVVTMAAGLGIDYVSSLTGGCRVIRIMPNTPALCGEGMILCSPGKGVSAETVDGLVDVLSGAGRIDIIDEKLIDAASALSGCGPAFAYIFCEALADGAVECGLPRDKAVSYAAQTLLGSAKMVLRQGDPGRLKDNVCSPGGTTIAGVHALESDGFRAAAMDAVVSAYRRTLELKK